MKQHQHNFLMTSGLRDRESTAFEIKGKYKSVTLCLCLWLYVTLGAATCPNYQTGMAKCPGCHWLCRSLLNPNFKSISLRQHPAYCIIEVDILGPHFKFNRAILKRSHDALFFKFSGTLVFHCVSEENMATIALW